MIRSALAVFATLLIACSTFAQSDPIGKWVGRIVVQDPNSKSAKLEPMPGPPGLVVYTLEIRKDGTYFTRITGTPDNKPHTAEGTWRRVGSKTTLTVQKRDGKPDTSEPKTRVLTMSADGKSLTTPMEGQVTARGPNGETTPPKGFVPPKISLLFKKA